MQGRASHGGRKWRRDVDDAVGRRDTEAGQVVVGGDGEELGDAPGACAGARGGVGEGDEDEGARNEPKGPEGVWRGGDFVGGAAGGREGFREVERGVEKGAGKAELRPRGCRGVSGGTKEDVRGDSRDDKKTKEPAR